MATQSNIDNFSFKKTLLYIATKIGFVQNKIVALVKLVIYIDVKYAAIPRNPQSALKNKVVVYSYGTSR